MPNHAPKAIRMDDQEIMLLALRCREELALERQLEPLRLDARAAAAGGAQADVVPEDLRLGVVQRGRELEAAVPDVARGVEVDREVPAVLLVGAADQDVAWRRWARDHVGRLAGGHAAWNTGVSSKLI